METAAIGGFRQALDVLVRESKIVIDRPKGGAHPRHPGFLSPPDHGHLKETTAMDGGGIDVWRSSDPAARAGGLACVVDLVKRDGGIKVLIGYAEGEKALIRAVHNQADGMHDLLIRRACHAALNATGLFIEAYADPFGHIAVNFGKLLRRGSDTEEAFYAV